MASSEQQLGKRTAVSLSLGAGAAGLLLYAHLVLLLSDTVLDEWELTLLRYLGRWLLPLYSIVCGVVAIGAPLGAVCGLLLRNSSPRYMLLAVAVIAGPFFFMHPRDPSVYTGPLVVGLAMWGTCYAIWRGVRPNNSSKPTPLRGAA